jgi:hypothetical protein
MRKRLKEKIEDLTPATVKGGIGAGAALAAIAHPEYASLLALTPFIPEWLNTVLPARQYERVVKMNLSLVAKVNRIDLYLLKDKLKDEQFQCLYEKGNYDASKAFTDLRIEAISNILLKGAIDSNDAIMANRCLSVISELDDMELGFLLYFDDLGQPPNVGYQMKIDFAEKWFNIDVKDARDVFSAHSVSVQQCVEKLESYGIFERFIAFRGIREVAFSESRPENKMVERNYSISPFGIELLGFIATPHETQAK